MAMRFSGAGTVVLSAAIATCGLFMLSGVGPSDANDVMLPAAGPAPTDEADTVPTTLATTPPPSDPDPDESTTTTSTTSTSTPSTTPTTTMPSTPSAVPLSVTASNSVVGAGGTVTFDGTCAVGENGPRGPVIVWVIGDSSDAMVVTDTGVSSAAWTYVWTAPTEESLFDSFTFQFWCGDPADHGGYPVDLQRRVDMVASEAPPSAPTLVESAPGPVIPETD